jgi:hypothetical protein
MTPGEKKAVLKYANRKYNGMYDFRFEGNIDNWLGLFVDVSKIDKNSSNYDKNYAEPLLKKKPIKKGTISFGNSKNILDDIRKEVKEYMDVKIPDTYFWFKNYEHIDDIEEKVKEVTKQMPEPFNQIQPTFGADQNYPNVKLTLYNIPSGKMDNFKDTTSTFIDMFKKIDNTIDLNQYRIAITYSKAPED